MIATGIDPGDPVHRVELDFDESGSATFVSKCAMSHDEAMRFRPPHGRLVAIERPFGLYLELSGAELFGVTSGVLMAAWIGGKLAGAMVRDGVRVIEVSCPAARRDAGVKIGGSVKNGTKREKVDQQTARLLPGLVRGWPKKSSTGARDAAIALLYAAKLVRLGTAERIVRDELEGRGPGALPSGIYGPGDYGPDSFGGSDCI